MRFKHTRRGDEVKFDPIEADVLAQCAGELLELLGPGPEESEDPLAALVGVTDATRPDDPAVLRLFPDGYGPEESDAASDFRRYTEAELRGGKRANAATVLGSVPVGGGTVLLDRDACDRWLGCLNDLRLVLGSRLEVTEETDGDDLPEELRQPFAIYGWLGYAQESLLSCLTPRTPPA